jgi:hypothetical protein
MTNQPEATAPKKRTTAAGRQDGDYPAPVLTEPAGGPVPDHAPAVPQPKRPNGDA